MGKLPCFSHLPFLLILWVRVFCLNVCLYTDEGQKRVAGPWELELHIVVSHQVGSGGTKPQSFARATSAVDHEAVSPDPPFALFDHLLRRRISLFGISFAMISYFTVSFETMFPPSIHDGFSYLSLSVLTFSQTLRWTDCSLSNVT